MEAVSKEAFLIEAWRIEPSLNRMMRADKTVQLEPKIMHVLLCLAASPHEVVSKEVLIETVWAETVVTEDVLARAISTLRKAFEDNARNPVYIETIRKVGYRLIAPVHYASDGLAVPGAQIEVVPNTWANPPETRPVAHFSKRWMAAALGSIVLLAAVLWWATRPPSRFLTSEPVPLTTDLLLEINPVFSPDGKQVAYSKGGPDDGSSYLFVQIIGNPTPLQLTEGSVYDASPAWNPQGTEVAFIRLRPSGCTLQIISALGGTPRHVADCKNVIYPDLVWSRDGRYLAYNASDTIRVGHAIHVVEVATGTHRQLTDPPSDIWGDYDPAFSPDGSKIAFARALSEGLQDLFWVEVETGAVERLTFDSHNLYGIDWLPDGKQIVFSSNKGGTYDLWALDPVTGAQALLLGGALHQANPSFDAAGERLAFEQRSYDTNIWRHTPNATEGTPWQPSTWWDMHPQFSPDGTQVAFASNRSGSYEIWLAEASGANPVQLTHFGGPYTGTPRWSPDGQYLVFDARPEGQAEIFTIDIRGGTPQQITHHPADDVAAWWAADGTAVYFSSNRSGRWEVWQANREGSRPRPVTTAGGFAPQATPDGKALYYNKYAVEGLWKRDLTTGSEQKVLSPLVAHYWGNWIWTPEGVYLLQQTDGKKHRVVRFNEADQTFTTVHTFEALIPAPDPAFAKVPGQMQFLIAQIDQRESDILYVDVSR